MPACTGLWVRYACNLNWFASVTVQVVVDIQCMEKYAENSWSMKE